MIQMYTVVHTSYYVTAYRIIYSSPDIQRDIMPNMGRGRVEGMKGVEWRG